MIEMIMEKWIAVAFIILVICGIRVLGRGRIRSGVIYGLWGLVVLRLMCPASITLPESRYSIQNWTVSQTFSQGITQEIVPEREELDSADQVQQNMAEQQSANQMSQQPDQQTSEQQPSQPSVVQPSSQPSLDQQLVTQQSSQQQTEHTSSSLVSFVMSMVPAWGYVWMVGSLLLAAVIVVSQVRFTKRLKRQRSLWKNADALTDLVDTPLPVYLWDGAASPFLYGILHPAIYLPSALAEDERTMEYAILHEWCHYRHGDHIWTLVRMICVVLYWHHPLVWVAASLSRSDCEMACDDAVRVRLGEGQRLAYAGSLLSILEAEIHREPVGYMTTSMSGGGREAANRMKLLWERRPGRILTVVVACVALVGVGCVAFTSTAATENQENSLAETDITEIYVVETHMAGTSNLNKDQNVSPAVTEENWYRNREKDAIGKSAPYLHQSIWLYSQPDLAAEMFLLQAEAESKSAEEVMQTLHLLETVGEYWIRVKAWNGTTGWLFMETPGILRIDGKLYCWDNFVVGPVVTKESLISTARRKMTYQEEEDWIKELLEKEPIPVTITQEGIQLMTDVLYQADLNEDGVLENFCYLGVNPEAYCPHFIINGRKYYMDAGYGTGDKTVPSTPTGIYVKYEGDDGRKQETYYLCNIRMGDGQTEFGLGHWSGGRKTSFLAYDGEQMDYIGTVDNIPIATADQYAFGVTSRELEQENLADGTWGFDGEGHIGLSMPMELLQTQWYANVVWELDETGNDLKLLPPANGLYEISDPWYYKEDTLFEDGVAEYPHLLQDLTVYAEPDLQAQTLVLSAKDHGPDNKIYFTHTDNEHWIRIEDDNGQVGWFYMENYDTILTDEGLVPALEIFGGLNQAG